jgi:hypothetical protein
MENPQRFFPTRAVMVAILGAIGTVSTLYGSGLLNGQLFWTGWLFIFIGLSAGCWAGRLWVTNHKTKHQMPDWLDSNMTFVWANVFCAVACCCAAFFSSKPLTKTALLVTPNRIQLASSTSLIRNGLAVFNPNDFPVFEVVVRVRIEPTGVPASSLIIDPGKPPLSQTNFGDIPVDFFRSDTIQRSISHPTNKYPDLIYLKFGFIPAKQERDFRISGSLTTNIHSVLNNAA